MKNLHASPRTAPLWPKLGSLGFQAALPIANWYFRSKNFHRPNSACAAERARDLAARLQRGETAYLVGLSIGGFHNTGAALVEVTPDGGARVLCNNEEERYSGEKHSNKYPRQSLAALAEFIDSKGIDPRQIVAWLATYDYALFIATGLRSMLEELPGSLTMMFEDHAPDYDGDQLLEGLRAPAELARLFGLSEPPPIIGMPHHDNHAYFSYMASPFARDKSPAMVAVIDGSGDAASVSLYLAENGRVQPLRSNNSLFDSLGMFYAVISATQGGWTMLSSEGRYMGATAYGDMNRATNRYYSRLKDIFDLRPGGEVRLNRSLANWHSSLFRKPYTEKLVDILGPPIAREDLWNPDAVLRVEDIQHHPNTQDRLDKAAATQLVFEDALIHVIDGLIRETGCDRLVLTGGAALNAVANMRVLDQFDEGFYRRALQRSTRLHLWIPPVPGDSGVTLGAAFAFAAAAGVGDGDTLRHAFYCGRAAKKAEILAALEDADDLTWVEVGDAAHEPGREAIADLMAFITAQDGVIAIFQGPAETGPRALGHRSILANPCNPATRETLNARVKYREAIRPLAPMMTLAAAQELFDLSEGAADDDYNVYNYMVLVARAKPGALARIPAVIHADGTARLQIVREQTDPVSHAYLKALGRRLGVEVAVNTSFNVAGPIAQTPTQAVETFRRAKGMDGAFLFSAEGPVMVVMKKSGADPSSRIKSWLADWKAEAARLKCEDDAGQSGERV
jgi:carbamoyltransferase